MLSPLWDGKGTNTDVWRSAGPVRQGLDLSQRVAATPGRLWRPLVVRPKPFPPTHVLDDEEQGEKRGGRARPGGGAPVTGVEGDECLLLQRCA